MRESLNGNGVVKIKNNYVTSIQNLSDMIIERTSEEVIIRLPSYVDTEELQRLVDYLTYKEATAKSKAKQADVDLLATKVKQGWWTKNRNRLVK